MTTEWNIKLDRTYIAMKYAPAMMVEKSQTPFSRSGSQVKFVRVIRSGRLTAITEMKNMSKTPVTHVHRGRQAIAPMIETIVQPQNPPV